MRALSIRQPYAELILRGTKRIEYRSRATKIIGERFLIYAYCSFVAERQVGASLRRTGWTGRLYPYKSLRAECATSRGLRPARKAARIDLRGARQTVCLCRSSRVVVSAGSSLFLSFICLRSVHDAVHDQLGTFRLEQHAPVADAQAVTGSKVYQPLDITAHVV